MSICRAPECASPARAAELCPKHYQRLRKRGSLDLPPRPTLRARLLSRTVLHHGCWVWSGARNDHGYGQIGEAGRVLYVHRVAYELFVGPIPDGHSIDHLCRRPGCLNPDHLEPVTQRENILRGAAPSAIAAVTSRCLRGHDLDAEGYVRPDGGGRICRACARIRDRKRRAVA